MQAPTDEIADIVEQLKQLNIQQSNLINRLGQLNESNASRLTTPSLPFAVAHRAPPVTVNEFAIGDRVRIKNPGLLQPSSGIVTKITAKRISVKGQTGSRFSIIQRAPKNLILE
jgi:hypothetical protein